MRIHWGHGITAIYALFAVVTVSFVVFAAGHPAELVRADYYEQSITHDRRAAAVARTEALAAQPVLEITGQRELRVVLPSAVRASGVAGTISLYRPSDAAADRSWPLALAADGSQRLPTGALPSGRWIVQIAWQADTLDYYQERTVTLP